MLAVDDDDNTNDCDVDFLASPLCLTSLSHTSHSPRRQWGAHGQSLRFFISNWRRKWREKCLLGWRSVFGWSHWKGSKWRKIQVQVSCCTLFFFFLAIPPGIQDLSSPPRDGTQAPLHWKCGVLTTGMLQNSPCSPLLLKILPKPHLSHYHLPARPTGSK